MTTTTSTSVRDVKEDDDDDDDDDNDNIHDAQDTLTITAVYLLDHGESPQLEKPRFILRNETLRRI
jgi:hypothetical protein